MPDSIPPSAPGIADIEAAARRLAGVAVRTPLLSQPLVDRRIGGRLLVKAEPLQVTGSFKFRGAYNRLSLIPPAERTRGVVAYSSGNHAQGGGSGGASSRHVGDHRHAGRRAGRETPHHRSLGGRGADL